MKQSTITLTPSQQLERWLHDELKLSNDLQALAQPINLLRKEYKEVEARYIDLKTSLDWLERLQDDKTRTLDASRLVRGRLIKD